MKFDPVQFSSPDAIRRQLSRILASNLFSAAPQQSKFLEHVVSAALDGFVVSEDAIGYLLFAPRYVADQSTIVRTTASLVRKRIAEYYLKHGAADEIVISLPAGRKYHPRFSLNPKYSLLNECQSLGRTVRGGYPRMFGCELGRLEQIAHEQPEYGPVYVELAETYLLYSLDAPRYLGEPESYLRYEPDIAQFLPLALKAAEQAVRYLPEYWLSHLLFGATRACAHEWAEAERSFATALKLSPENTKINFWYAAFLYSRGRLEEGLAVVEFRAGLEPDNPRTQCLRALFLWMAGEREKARYCISRDQTPYPIWLGGLIKALMLTYASTEAPPGFGDELRSQATTQHAAVNEFIKHGEALDIDRRRVYGGPNPSPQYQIPDVLNVFPFPGFWAFIHERAANAPAAHDARRLTELSRRHFQHAIASAAFQGNAVLPELTRAIERREPLVLWIRLWPFFEYLHGNAKFEALVDKVFQEHGRVTLGRESG